MKRKVDKRNLHVGIISQSPDFGGAEEFMLNLISEFKHDGHQVSAATNQGRYFDYLKNEIKDVNSIPFYLDIIGNLKGLFKTILLLPYAIYFYVSLINSYKKKNVDILLLSNFTEKLLVSVISFFYKIPVVWIEYGPLRSVLKRNFYIPKILYQILKNIPYKIIVPSLNTQKSLIDEEGMPPSKIDVIPCGVVVKNFFKKKKYDGSIVVGNISRQTREKGQEYLIDAIPSIVKENKNVEFLFVGDGPDLNRYKARVRSLKIEKYVKFSGFVKNTSEYYSKMDIFVFPSIWKLEGFGLVAVEAMSRKIPVIGNNHGPLKETLGNGAGILVNIKDKHKLASCILDLLDNEKKREKIGNQGFNKVAKNYNIELIAKQYEKVFYEIIK